MERPNSDVVRQLRQIKWLLVAIALCLLAILFALTPGLLQVLTFLAVASVAGALVTLVWLVGRDRWRAIFSRLGRRQSE